MIILMTLLITGASMFFAVHQWWRGHHMIAIGFSSLKLRGASATAMSV